MDLVKVGRLRVMTSPVRRSSKIRNWNRKPMVAVVREECGMMREEGVKRGLCMAMTREGEVMLKEREEDMPQALEMI
jgi:hypothetical protein